MITSKLSPDVREWIKAVVRTAIEKHEDDYTHAAYDPGY